MKFNCGRTWEEKRDAKEKWHRWFAWYPIRLGSRHCRWLEVVWRKGKFTCDWGESLWFYQYSISVNKPKDKLK
jgi:hypothetical protein